MNNGVKLFYIIISTLLLNLISNHGISYAMFGHELLKYFFDLSKRKNNVKIGLIGL